MLGLMQRQFILRPVAPSEANPLPSDIISKTFDVMIHLILECVCVGGEGTDLDSQWG